MYSNNGLPMGWFTGFQKEFAHRRNSDRLAVPCLPQNDVRETGDIEISASQIA